MKRCWRFLLFASFFLFIGAQPTQAQTPTPGAVVRAVLFYSPSCGHCHKVITEVLPPLFEHYGDQLYIVGVDVTQADGQALFITALQYFGLESSGVPFLVVGKTYLFGSIDIPQKFPGLIEEYLAQGGVDWPDIPGLAEAMAAAQSAAAPTADPSPVETLPTLAATTAAISPTLAAATSTSVPTPTAGLLLTGSETGGLGAGFANDPLGNSLAVAVLVGMLLSVGWAIPFFRRSPGTPLAQPWEWAIPILCIIGLGVAGYLAYVETAHIDAVCGPVGDCNTVQQSEYARLFGALPIGILGILGYVMILLAWVVERWGNRQLSGYAGLALLGMTTFGVLFSIYLTFLEPFVIGATCAWCLTSAVIMTALFWLALPPGKLAIESFRNPVGQN